MTSSLSEVDDLLTEEFPLLSGRPAAAAAALLPPGADEPSPGEGGPGLGSLLGWPGGGREAVQLGGGEGGEGGGRHHRLLHSEHFRADRVSACAGSGGWCWRWRWWWGC